ncbi:pentapeptide repeat-containing protein [Actinosynnema sp. NPDC047251]|uniref:Pentapeptide repeat-containing protein n=1 Tax=Saccharothrix espanaensis (strain ATCC 51144 / DSM 44229 / JCM 9112 / NBRC 15066 / NRRL 15764) TaxID=1179773 RepID=K0K5S0_SACES|nr:pentapeptide repeat-containing protein [Saccharothrix espanaensis]CCH35595.1 hypothetical protein BN6_83790 [Saccharothrix espanaensis DSM 44229]
MHDALRLFDAYWPALLAFLTLLVVWRLGRAAFRVWSGQDGRADPGERVRADGARGSMAWAVIKWLLLAVVLAGVTGFGLFWLLGRPALPSAASFTTAELLDLLKIGLAVVGGLGAVVALAVAYRKQQVSEAAHTIATRQDERESTKFFNERYGKAAEQLGHESFAVRLAGVYAMAGLANDWPQQRQTCVDVLCGYLRTPYPRDDRTEREVRQAIITTLLGQDWRSRALRMDFRGVEFENLDLAGQSFTGDHMFDNATFHGDLTDFRNATFRGTVTFRGARFTAADTSFVGITARQATLAFTGAEFTGDLVDFGGARLTESELDLSGCTFRGTTLDFSGLDAVPVDPVTGRESSLVLRSADAERCTIRFAGSRVNHLRLHLDGARFADCVLEADGVVAAEADLSVVGVEPEEFAQALRRMKERRAPEGARRSGGATAVDQ